MTSFGKEPERGELEKAHNSIISLPCWVNLRLKTWEDGTLGMARNGTVQLFKRLLDMLESCQKFDSGIPLRTKRTWKEEREKLDSSRKSKLLISFPLVAHWFPYNLRQLSLTNSSFPFFEWVKCFCFPTPSLSSRFPRFPLSRMVWVEKEENEINVCPAELAKCESDIFLRDTLDKILADVLSWTLHPFTGFYPIFWTFFAPLGAPSNILIYLAGLIFFKVHEHLREPLRENKACAKRNKVRNVLPWTLSRILVIFFAINSRTYNFL